MTQATLLEKRDDIAGFNVSHSRSMATSAIISPTSGRRCVDGHFCQLERARVGGARRRNFPPFLDHSVRIVVAGLVIENQPTGDIN